MTTPTAFSWILSMTTPTHTPKYKVEHDPYSVLPTDLDNWTRHWRSTFNVEALPSSTDNPPSPSHHIPPSHNNLTESSPSDTCKHSHVFHFLKGDLILLGGFYGSHLVNKHTQHREWLSMELLLGLKHSSQVHLPLKDEILESTLRPDGIMKKIGLFDICSLLVKELKAWQVCSKGLFTFHEFSYDWRREGQCSAKQLLHYMESIYDTNGHQPMTIVAHSMGGLIALSALNQKPHLFKGIVFCGTPFGPCPLILWGLQRGAPFARVFSPEMHFISKSSFLFLPRDGKGLVDDKDQDILVDYFNPQEWVDFKLSKVFKKVSLDQNNVRDSLTDLHLDDQSPQQSPIQSPQHSPQKPVVQDNYIIYFNYLKKSLKLAKKFHNSLAFNPSIKYPPLICISAEAWPTPTRLRCFLKHRKSSNGTSQTVPEIRVSHPCFFEPGDGVVSLESAKMPPGYEYGLIFSNYSHISLMNDLDAIVDALKRI